MHVSFHELERIVRGFSNHRRIQILDLLERKPELSIVDIAEELDVDFRTVSSHVKKLSNTGLLMKRHDLQSMRHKLTRRGKKILMFVRTLE